MEMDSSCETPRPLNQVTKSATPHTPNNGTSAET